MPNPFGIDDNIPEMRDISLQERVNGPSPAVTLTEKAFDRVLDLMEHPPKPSERLRKIMSFDQPLAGPLLIDLACGQTPRAGFQGVDLFAPTAQHKWDVLKFPWPLANDSVDELHSSHFVEHIPMAYVDAQNNLFLDAAPGRKDLFIAFFDEAFRVLKPDVKPDPATGFPGRPGGRFTVIVPYLQSQRAFQDPTHRRFLCEASFLYLAKSWRDANKLDHYGIVANFDMHLDRTTDGSEAARNPETQGVRATHYWNVVQDLHAILSKRTY